MSDESVTRGSPAQVPSVFSSKERAALAAIRDGHGHDYVDWAARNERLVVAPHAIAAP